MALSDTVINGSWKIAEPVSYLLTVRITEEQELTHERSPVRGRCLPRTSPTICANAFQFIFLLFTEVQTCQNGFLTHYYVHMQSRAEMLELYYRARLMAFQG